jgi:wyosine [tRNA(Phe)-imidazoG37] synthetase (radical SAM superfamily)
VIAFGPVPSRRLGRSLGVNNIPAKHCTYSCSYCQVGRTHGTEIERRAFHARDAVVAAVARKLGECRARGEPVDYITFVPDGEPTLEIDLGGMMRELRHLHVPLAVITNGSLLGRQDVRADLAEASLVSVKIDTAEERTWRRLNRPHSSLHLAEILEGLRDFAKSYRGVLLTETMLVAGVNDADADIDATATFLAELSPARAYLAIPTRPPADRAVRPPTRTVLTRAVQRLARVLPRLGLLTEDEAGPFAQTGDPIDDLLAILAIHPMREEAAKAYLAASTIGAEGLDALLAAGSVMRCRYRDRTFVRRARPTPHGPE